jgi:integrase/recombinase XerD
VTLGAAVDSFLRHVSIERGLAPNTVAAYRRDLVIYCEWLAGRELVDPGAITAQHISEFVRFLSQRVESPLTASSVARILSTVRGLHRFLLEESIVDADVAHDIRPPKLATRLPKAISIDQVARLLAATDGDDLQQLRDKALLELLYATGARVSEAVSLNVDDVIDDDIVRLRGKGDKQRIVPVGSYARAALDAYLIRSRPVMSSRGQATPALFLGIRGQRVSRQNAWLIIRAAAERAALGVEVSPHTLRHSFATHLLAGGADVRVVQELLGHSSVATTQLYTLVTADTLRDMYTTAHPRARFHHAHPSSETPPTGLLAPETRQTTAMRPSEGVAARYNQPSDGDRTDRGHLSGA